MENKPYGVIYKITNLVNGKIYIGQTKQKPKRRWVEHKAYANSKTDKHNMIITKAMIKHGINNFIFEVIDNAYSPKELNQLEEKYIKRFGSLAPNGYNIHSYSDTTKIISEETKMKTTKSLIKKCRKRKNSLSKYYGVTKQKNNWGAQIIFKGKIKRLGSFKREIDAAYARDIECLKPEYMGLFELNFPELKDKYINNEIVVLRYKDERGRNSHQGIKRKRKTSSIYVGVYLDKSTNRWISRLRFNNKYLYLGRFDNETDAAKAYDAKAFELFGDDAKLNFSVAH